MLTAIARLVTEQPRRVLIATAVFFVIAVGVGAPVAALLSVQPDEDFVDSASENSVTTERLEQIHGSTLSPGVIVLVRGDAPVTSARGQAQLRPIVARLRADPAVARVGAALQSAPEGRQFIARDGRSSFVAVFLKKDAGGDEAKRIDAAMNAFPNVKTGGLAVAGPEVGDLVSADLAKAELLAFPLLFLLSLVIFRGAIAALLPLFVGFLTIMATFLGLRIINEMAPLSIFALNLAIGLGLGLAIDYSLFVLSRYREEMERFGPGREALANTLRTAGRTVVFSSLTVAAAMLALLVFP
jgi:RND superfamily putative drug exporter